MKKKIFLLLIVLSAVLTSVGFAKPEVIKTNDDPAQRDYHSEEITTNGESAQRDYHSELGRKVVNDGIVQYEIVDPEQIANEVMKDNFQVPEGKKVEKIVTYYTEPKNNYALNSILSEEGEPGNNLACGIGCYVRFTAENVVNQGNLWYFESEGITNSYQGPSTATMTVETSKKAKWSAEGILSRGTVSAAVGWSLTENYTVSGSHTVSVGSGKIAYITAWPYYQKKTFDVYQSNYMAFVRVRHKKVGEGYSYKPTRGVRFRHYIVSR